MKERLEFGFRGLEGALDRVADYSPDDRFFPLAEAFLWIDLIDGAYWIQDEEQGTGYREFIQLHELGPTRTALRYARNRFVHDIGVYGMHGGIFHAGAFSSGFSEEFDITTTRWIWRRLGDLPAWEGNTNGEHEYREELEGEDVEPTLRAMGVVLAEDWDS